MPGAYETVIGLECHVELSTRTKMFCGCLNEFGSDPNTNVCPVCLGHPGSLPVPNEKAIEYIMRIGLALGCEIAPRSLFHRKNYFYPDMPKNFQISQFDLPICVGGHLDVEVGGQPRRIGITRVHMEEDTGKTTHAGATGRIADADYALVDFNRAGVPLVEVVSEPDMRSPEEAAAYLRELRATLESLDVSDVRMEEGSLRCDANVSVRPVGTTELGVKVEIKNMNSVRSLERAIRYEQARQVAALEAGEALVQETRHWNEEEAKTSSMRSKEEAFDYRYFPEPDLSPLEPDRAWVQEIRAGLPELPAALRTRYETEFGLKPAQAKLLAEERVWGSYFEATVHAGADPVGAANWVTQDLAGFSHEAGLSATEATIRITPEGLARVLELVEEGTLSKTGAKQVVEVPFISSTAQVLEPATVMQTVEEKGLKQVSDESELGGIIDGVIEANPEPVEKFRSGNESVLGFLVGQVMKASGGSANPKLAGELLRARLSK